MRLAVAVLVVAGACLHEGDFTETEHDVFLFFNRLPNSLQSLVEIVYRAGARGPSASWWRRRSSPAARLSRDLALSGRRLDRRSPPRR